MPERYSSLVEGIYCMRQLLKLLIGVQLLAALAPPASVAADDRSFRETGECIGVLFGQYWDGNGGLPVFGFPIGEQAMEQGTEGAFTTQWFERDRFEAHPEN